MAYTVAKLAKLSGVSVRTLHWYDEVGLLKPAYHGANGYRYYEEEQLLVLQQILFFRELGFELKKIKKILGRGDFDKMAALSAHRIVLQKNVERVKRLIKTIDKTLEHLKGTKKMKDAEIYYGFSKETQAEYEKQIFERLGEKGKAHIAESKRKVKNWSKADWDQSKNDFDQICNDLVIMMKKGKKTNAKEVQEIISRHHQWLKKFWTPTSETYAAHAQFILESDLKKAYASFHPELPEYIAAAIKVFAEQELP